MRSLIFCAIIILLFGFTGQQAWPDCTSDCQNDYQSAVNFCSVQYSDPNDADDLMACMDNAKKEYESCLQECETEPNSTQTIVPSFQESCRGPTLARLIQNSGKGVMSF